MNKNIIWKILKGTGTVILTIVTVIADILQDILRDRKE